MSAECGAAERVHRRGLIKRAASVVAVGGAASLAGCSSATSSSSLQVTNVACGKTITGDVKLKARVKNTGSAKGTGTLVGKVTLHNGNVYTSSQQVQVPAGGSRIPSVKIGLPLSKYGSGAHCTASIK